MINGTHSVKPPRNGGIFYGNEMVYFTHCACEFLNKVFMHIRNMPALFALKLY